MYLASRYADDGTHLHARRSAIAPRGKRGVAGADRVAEAAALRARQKRDARAQLLLKLGELEKLAAAPGPKTATITYERAAGPAPKRTLPAESFAHLPVKETVEIVPEAVRADPSLYEKLGVERTFEVDLVPPQLFKREIVRPKYRHRLDPNRAPLLAPAPPRVVAGGFASAGLIAWALTAKYCDHLPLYRQEKMLARWGAPICKRRCGCLVGVA